MTFGKRILISVVDDDKSVRKTLVRIAQFAGLEVEAFESAEEFLDGADGKEYACLILDVHLPGISGIDLQKQLKVANPTLPIIFISAQADEETREAALKEGAISFFMKPFNKDSLLDAIRSLLPAKTDLGAA